MKLSCIVKVSAFDLEKERKHEIPLKPLNEGGSGKTAFYQVNQIGRCVTQRPP